MRLDAQKGDRRWQVYHAEECALLKHVLWIDTDSAQWAEAVEPYRVVDGELLLSVHQARKIDILADQRLVVINPIEDVEREGITIVQHIGIGGGLSLGVIAEGLAKLKTDPKILAMIAAAVARRDA